MSFCGEYFCGTLVLLIAFGFLFENASAYLDPDDLPKRIGASLLEPGLPWLLEKREEQLEPDLVYSDSPWDSSFTYDSGEAPLDTEIARSMEQRARRELELMRRTLSGEAVPYGSSDESYKEIGETISRRVTRDFNPSPILTPNGLRSHFVWKPIAIGSLCAVLGVIVIVASITYYQKIHLPQKGARRQETEIGAAFVDGVSPHGSLLGETTSLSLEGDRKLAHSAQMYHYQHQKQQMLAVEKSNDHAQGSEEGSGSDVEEGDFTVYECPGLAEPNQLELENPLYEGEFAGQDANATGVYGLQPNDELEDESDSTPTAKTVNH